MGLAGDGRMSVGTVEKPRDRFGMVTPNGLLGKGRPTEAPAGSSTGLFGESAVGASVKMK